MNFAGNFGILFAMVKFNKLSDDAHLKEGVIMRDLENKVALVTGGGSGIGESTSLLLAERGAKVVVADMNLENAERVAAKIGADAIAVKGNVAEPADTVKMVEVAIKTFGALHIAVNNAGIGGVSALTGDYPVDEWRKVIAVNLDGVFFSMKAEIPAMLASGGGSIINIASILGSVGFANSSAYTAAKHGVVGLTKAAALEYSAQGIRVNSVGPGFIRTPLLESALDEPTLEFLTGLHANNRIGKPEEVAELIAFLASEKASNMTGAYYLVDGGFTAR
jgi:NAD(P)-dependent dehydrogenase (short-subunit alcohol dehydrogenase family)